MPDRPARFPGLIAIRGGVELESGGGLGGAEAAPEISSTRKARNIADGELRVKPELEFQSS